MTCLSAVRRSLADLLDPGRLLERLELRELRETAVRAAQDAERASARAAQDAERASARIFQLRVEHSAALAVVQHELDDARHELDRVRADLAMWLGRGLDQPAREEER